MSAGGTEEGFVLGVDVEVVEPGAEDPYLPLKFVVVAVWE